MRIGEIAHRVGVATSTIRFYEEAGLLPTPERTSSGYRDYDSSVVDRLGFIRAGQAVGLALGKLKGILEIRDHGELPCSHVRDLLVERIEEIVQRIRELSKRRAELAAVAEQAEEFDPADCPPESICRIRTRP